AFSSGQASSPAAMSASSSKSTMAPTPKGTTACERRTPLRPIGYSTAWIGHHYAITLRIHVPHGCRRLPIPAIVREVASRRRTAHGVHEEILLRLAKPAPVLRLQRDPFSDAAREPRVESVHLLVVDA